ncbi:MAG TPA: tetratricopeptide repeat-containing glycosyltransferase family protein [Caulobacteraceae bacterium]|jgi:tetratricopeptide (TPR) repeat protein|nr:tetratricopeptide repeat-containing glycosyltransferase family protein [Caulobacteraceae bacterium]
MSPDPAVPALMEAAAAAHRAGRLGEAKELYQQLLETDPDQAEVLHRLATIALAEGRVEDGVLLLRRTLALAPQMLAAHLNLALALEHLGQGEAALASYERAIAVAPRHAETHARHGDLMLRLGRYETSLAAYDRALALDPRLARAWSNRGLALLGLGRTTEAVESFDGALALDPGFVDALVNRGIALRELNRLDASLASLGAALQAAPDNPAAACNLGVSQLLAGALEPGFRGHEQRWRLEPNRSALRTFAAPLWQGGEDLAGRTLLLHAEQGFGDTIQFCRYAALAAARGARVVLEAPPALKALMRSLDGVAELVGAGEPLPDFDLHCPLMSLPHAFGTTLETIPTRASYLAAPPERSAAWAGVVADSPRPKVGLAWFGKPTHHNDRNRSIRLEPLLEALPSGLELFSLQDRARPEDEAALAAYPRIRRFEDRLTDFADTAALASQMDLVVSVDTSTAHLAAALGRPTWVLLPFSPDWRWLLDREDSPWYPTVRLFRQPAPGDWDSVLARLGEALSGVAKPG